MRFTEEDLKENGGKPLLGRIAEYSTKRGFGHIYAENRKDVFLSSYALGKLEKRVAIGTTLRFVPKLVEGKICATEIEVVDLFPNGRTFPLPNKQNVYVRNVQRFGIVSGEKALKDVGITKEELEKNGHTLKDIEYLFVSLKDREYRFFGKNSPVKGDGQINIESVFRNLCNTFFYLDGKKK